MDNVSVSFHVELNALLNTLSYVYCSTSFNILTLHVCRNKSVNYLHQVFSTAVGENTQTMTHQIALKNITKQFKRESSLMIANTICHIYLYAMNFYSGLPQRKVFWFAVTTFSCGCRLTRHHVL